MPVGPRAARPGAALITERVKEIAAADHDIALWLASLYSLEGMIDEGIEWVRQAVRLGNENYPLFASLRKLDALRNDERFERSSRSCG